jgi:hypothetical protein
LLAAAKDKRSLARAPERAPHRPHLIERSIVAADAADRRGGGILVDENRRVRAKAPSSR